MDNGHMTERPHRGRRSLPIKQWPPLPWTPCQSAPAGRRPTSAVRRPTTVVSPIWAATA